MKFYILFCFCIAISCTSNVSQINTSETPEKSWTPSYAKGFKINFYKNYSDLILLDLQNPGDTMEIIRILNQTPTSVALLSTTHVSYAEHLDALASVKGVAFASYVKNANALTRIKEGKILELSGADDVDMEKLLSIKPDWFFVYPYGHGNYEKYTSKGIPCIPISEYLETHPLGRAEWIFAFGLVLQKWKEAEIEFTQIEKAYTELKNATAHIKDEKRPCVFSGSDNSGTWFASPGNSFQGTWLHDAGAKYIFQDSIAQGNISLPFERLFKIVHDCDFWGRIDAREKDLTLQEIIQEDPRFGTAKSIREKQVFYCNSTDTDYFGDAVLEPQIILADLIYIFHPEILPDHQPKYFKRLEN